MGTSSRRGGHRRRASPCRPGGDPRDFRRQQPYPRRNRALRARRLSGGRARDVRSHPADSIPATRADDIAKGREIMGSGLGQVDARCSRPRASVVRRWVGWRRRFLLGGSLAWVAPRVSSSTRPCATTAAGLPRSPRKNPCARSSAFRYAGSEHPHGAVEEIKAAQPKVPVFIYEAGHGFSCDQRGSFNKAAREEAWKRTLQHFGRFL